MYFLSRLQVASHDDLNFEDSFFWSQDCNLRDLWVNVDLLNPLTFSFVVVLVDADSWKDEIAICSISCFTIVECTCESTSKWTFGLGWGEVVVPSFIGLLVGVWNSSSDLDSLVATWSPQASFSLAKCVLFKVSHTTFLIFLIERGFFALP